MEMSPNKESSDLENSIYEERIKAIQAMPPGKKRDEAISELSRDYEGREGVASDKLGTAQSRFDSSMEPLSMRKGPSGNPFAVDTAPHALEQAGRGLSMYNASKDIRDARAERNKLSEGRESATRGLIGGGIDGTMSDEEKWRKKQEAQAKAARRGMTRA